MAQEHRPHLPHVSAVRRHGEEVTPLELFFDLVFVLALTQCTALISHEPTWEGVAKGLLVLSLLWWSWIGYAWLTSVLDPEEGGVRLIVFATMAAFLVAALCVPEVFEDSAITFAVAFGVVRAAHIALFVIASRDEPQLRHSVVGLGISTALSVGLVLGAAFCDGTLQGALWLVALTIDVGGPYLFGAEGWQLSPRHFAERHGLIIIIALGESVVALGVGAEAGVSGPVVAAAVLAIALIAGLWWAYFDVTARVAAGSLEQSEEGRVRNELARDSYSILHLPMVAGVVLLAVGLEATLAHVRDPLPTIPAFGLTGGVTLYLLAHVAFKRRHHQPFHWARLVMAGVVLAVWPLAREVDALASLAVVTALVAALIAYESIRYADVREAVRHRE